MRSSHVSIIRTFLSIFAAAAVITLCTAAVGQDPSTALVSLGSHATTSAKEIARPESDSIITGDDVLDVYVMDVPELSRQYRVAPSGTVVLPLLSSALPASGRTPSQFSSALAKELRDSGLVMDPHIVVTIISSRLKSVAITGAVKMPQIYPVLGRTTLIDMLSQAQGLADDAGNSAIVSRGELGESAIGEATQTVDLKKLLDTGSSEYNLAIYPGDRITVPRAGIVYVVGAVNKPGGYVIKGDDNGMPVLQALAMAEDTKSTAIRNKTVILRPDKNAPDGHKQIPLDLSQILAGKQPDQKLQANDILFVPDSTAKKAFRRGLEAALQTATGLAIYARY